MKRTFCFALVCVGLLLCACGRSDVPAVAETVERDGYVAIVWEDRTYVPFCVVSKSDCGKVIGCVNGDTEDIISEYKHFPPGEWIANYLTVDGGAILYKEEQAAAIPDGLEPEYEWNF